MITHPGHTEHRFLHTHIYFHGRHYVHVGRYHREKSDEHLKLLRRLEKHKQEVKQ